LSRLVENRVKGVKFRVFPNGRKKKKTFFKYFREKYLGIAIREIKPLANLFPVIL